MSLFRSENNTFCDTVKVEVPVDGKVEKVRPSRNFKSPQQPYKLEAVSVKFEGGASGSVNVRVVKSGVELLAAVLDVNGSDTAIIANIGLWLTDGDEVRVENKTDQAAVAIVDFAY